jgi:hypothetical protein
MVGSNDERCSQGRGGIGPKNDGRRAGWRHRAAFHSFSNWAENPDRE